jgi:putative FmdB family regulatory protein
MPIYEFECTGCGRVWDELLKLSDADPASCSRCQSDQVRRRVTAAAFRLKGAGWYETDFKNDRETKRNIVDGGNGKEPAVADSAKSEPAATSAPSAVANATAPSSPSVASSDKSKSD